MSDTGAIPNPSKGDFERLLNLLDEDRDRAAEKYESLRRRLVKFFLWNHSCRAEELVDRTLTRLEKKMQSEDIGNTAAYALGIARNIHREVSKESRRITALEDVPGGQESFGHPQGLDEGVLENIDNVISLACLEKCRAKLPFLDGRLAIEYYSAENEKQKDHRERLAKRTGITRNALAVRVNRIRERLEKCVTTCLENRRRALAKPYSGGQP